MRLIITVTLSDSSAATTIVEANSTKEAVIQAKSDFIADGFSPEGKHYLVQHGEKEIASGIFTK